MQKGDVMVVIGPSGSGKSTFLRSLNLLEKPTGGTIIFQGVNITDRKIDINVHRQKMGMVFQHFNLFPHKTILDNMTLAPIKVKKCLLRQLRRRHTTCLSALDSRIGPELIPSSSPAVRSSEWPSSGH